MKIKMTLKFHLTPVRMAVIKKNKQQQILVRMEEETEPLHTVGGSVN
jgi:hypothetical protein